MRNSWQYQICNKATKAKKNKSTQNHSSTVQIQYHFTKNTQSVTFLTFPKIFTPQKCQIRTKIEITTKHCMFSYKFYPKPKNFTPSRMVWMVTFSKSVSLLTEILQAKSTISLSGEEEEEEGIQRRCTRSEDTRPVAVIATKNAANGQHSALLYVCDIRPKPVNKVKNVFFLNGQKQ